MLSEVRSGSILCRLGAPKPQTNPKSTPNNPDRTSDNLKLQPHGFEAQRAQNQSQIDPERPRQDLDNLKLQPHELPNPGPLGKPGGHKFSQTLKVYDLFPPSPSRYRPFKSAIVALLKL